MAREVKDEDFFFLGFEEAAAPTSGSLFQMYKDFWWAVDPVLGVAFYNPTNQVTGKRRHRNIGAPQCNTDRRIAEQLKPRVCTEVRQIERVWVPVYLRDLV